MKAWTELARSLFIFSSRKMSLLTRHALGKAPWNWGNVLQLRHVKQVVKLKQLKNVTGVNNAKQNVLNLMKFYIIKHTPCSHYQRLRFKVGSCYAFWIATSMTQINQFNFHTHKPHSTVLYLLSMFTQSEKTSLAITEFKFYVESKWLFINWLNSNKWIQFSIFFRSFFWSLNTQTVPSNWYKAVNRRSTSISMPSNTITSYWWKNCHRTIP